MNFFKRKYAEYLFRIGSHACEGGFYEKAVRHGKKIIQLAPQFSGGYDIYASALEAIDKKDEALKILLQGIERNPASYLLFEKLCIAYSERKEYEKALDAVNKAIELNPKTESLYYNRAIVYANRENYREALTDLEKIISMNDEFFNAYILQASILNKLKMTDEAIGRMEILARTPLQRFGVDNLDELQTKIYLNLAVSYNLKGDKEKSEEWKKKAEEIL